MRVVNTREMKEIEELAEKEFGLEESLIIENVGIRGADFIHHEYISKRNYGEIVFFIGKGNNGADGLAVARHLMEFGYKARAFMLFSKDECSEELQRQAVLAKGLGVKISEVISVNEIESYFEEAQEEYFVIDAIFGTGVRLPLSSSMSEVLELMNSHSSVQISIDMPSGVYGDTGKTEGAAVVADMTLAIGVPKVGYYSNNGAQHSGEIKVLSAGFPKEFITSGPKNLITQEMIARILGKRNKFSHKNSFGHTIVIGGSKGQVGAVILASNGALKVGAGLVTVATWDNCYDELARKINPEIMTRSIPTDKQKVQQVLHEINRFDSVVIGPGLGCNDLVRDLVIGVLEHFTGPVVLDADAINALDLKKDKELLFSRKYPTVMTPHLGEFSGLSGKTVAETEGAPITNLRELVEEINSYVILKGPGSYVNVPSGEVFINYMPNAGMATGGSGDVLAGIIGGLLAQAQTGNQKYIPGIMTNIWDASVCLGLYVHSLSGQHAAFDVGPRAMTAWSIINNIYKAFAEIKKVKESLR